MLYLDMKFARLAGQSIDRFKVKKESPFHCSGRCKICGDSATNKSKTRFHFKEYNGVVFAHCFNCGYAQALIAYLKKYEPALYSEYVFEKYRSGCTADEPVVKTTPTAIKTPIKTGYKLPLPLVSNMDTKSPVSVYIASRGLPEYPFQYAEKFYEFSSQFHPDLKDVKKDEPRLIIPFFDRKGSVFAYQGRDLSGKSSLKYITITIDPKTPKIFGIDRVDFKKQILIVEGPIDSLFLPNCLASVNGSLVATANKLLGIVPKENITLVYDNEPRNAVIVGEYQKAIELGYKIVLWPKALDGVKDINDMVQLNKNPVSIIQKNTYSGLSAKLEFNRWKKV